ncbi:MAG: hypothetical protein KGL39_53000 [Patescibacteria group bacterium]|nr:hypothetical protein [Patescibacteria group bacterium]
MFPQARSTSVIPIIDTDEVMPVFGEQAEWEMTEEANRILTGTVDE